ncbi:MAG: hypothetical protein U0165_13680, partial [Polyangiaceae bacterium]
PPDTRSWHPTLGFRVGTEQPMGSIETGRSHYDNFGFGSTLGLQLELPFSRNFGVQLWGYQGKLTGTIICPDCKGTTMAGGVALVYHILDGVPIDPWFSGGFGYRSTKYDRIDNTGLKLDYTGVVAPRFSFGADYYLIPQVGIGASLDLSFGRYYDRSPSAIPRDSGDVHSFVGGGLRIVLRPF